MKFRTELDISPFSFSIDHHSQVVLLGSCFSNNIGSKLNKQRIPFVINPHGIVFNPVSLSNILFQAQESHLIDNGFFLERNGFHFSYQHHSEIFAKSKDALKTLISTKNLELKHALTNSKVVFITLGTAWIYQLASSKAVVSNCHKIVQSNFEKRILKTAEIEESIISIISSIKKLNQKAEIVFTLSPVRHIKDGITENQRSKSLLLSCLHNVVDTERNATYFPSYEIMMDDLRDYRFYEKDLIHPNEIAIDYIWDKFSGAFFSKKTQQVNKLISKLNVALQHRFLNMNPSELEKFKDASLNTCQEILKQTGLDMQKEIDYFENLTT